MFSWGEKLFKLVSCKENTLNVAASDIIFIQSLLPLNFLGIHLKVGWYEKIKAVHFPYPELES